METAESFGSKSFGSKAASRSVHVPHNSRMALTLPPNRGPDAGHREVSPIPMKSSGSSCFASRSGWRSSTLPSTRHSLAASPASAAPDGAAANTTTTAPVDGKAAKFPSATVGSA